MARPYYDRLSALDAAMVFLEAPNTHMHVGAIGLFESGPLATAGGGIAVERLKAHMAGVLDESPRYRQRLAYIPLEEHPVWVDDAHFNLDYHVLHAALPHPGGIRQLQQMIGRIMSQPLDPTKPLWEVWLIEGLEGGRFAMVNKMHHCMVDGIAAVQAISGFFSTDPTAQAHRPSSWRPRRAPSPRRLVTSELRRRAGLPLVLARELAPVFRDPARSLSALRDALAGGVEAIAEKMRPASITPLSPGAGSSHRYFDWLRFDLDDTRAIRTRLGGTLNDVVLATAAGGVRRFLQARRVPVRRLDFRVVVPVNTRRPSTQQMLGNRIVPMLARLPVGRPTPRDRLRQVIKTTRALKASRQIPFVELFEDAANWTEVPLVATVVRRATRWWAGNMIVTNIPGPPVPLYLLGARVLECYPLVPFMANQAVSVAVLSYAGTLHWGFYADADTLPDVHDFVRCVAEEFAALRRG